MMYRKKLTVTVANQTSTVELNGVGAREKLTPKMARRALRIAIGNDAGGQVSDGQNAYRIYAKSARRLY
jgi:hypothetical protein